MITIRNPHSILAVLDTRPQDITEIRVTPRPSDAWAKVEVLARKKGLRVSVASGGSQSSGNSDKQGRESGSFAAIKEKPAISAEELFAHADERASGRGLWLALDSLQDPHNVGAIFRAASFFGVEGILVTEERSAPMSSVVYDVASGGTEYVPFCIQTNLQRAFEIAKENGLWILGTSEHATDSHLTIQKDRPWLLVLGNEEKGMRRLTEESCDVLCGIAPAQTGPGVTSLNVSVAAGILISHLSQSK